MENSKITAGALKKSSPANQTLQDTRMAVEVQSNEVQGGEVLQTFGYKRLFRFFPELIFKEAEIPFTPAFGDYIAFNNSVYKVSKVLHDVTRQETRITCARAN